MVHLPAFQRISFCKRRKTKASHKYLMSFAIFASFLMQPAFTEAKEAKQSTRTPPPSAQNDMAARMQAVQAQIEIGVNADNEGNSVAAVAAFDAADRAAPGFLFLSPEVHAIRATSFNNVGREDDALREARLAYDFITEGPTVSKEIRVEFFASSPYVDLDLVYTSTLIILKKNNDPRFEPGLRTYLARIPTTGTGWSNRGLLLNELKRFPDAIAASQQALTQLPREPGVLNNHCFILASAGKSAEGLPFCERAIRLRPNSTAIRSSYSTVLANLGRCTQAAEQKAIALRLDPNDEEALKPLECTPKR
jgi:tetratricopeptide (TPR) repeat protein